MRHVNIIVGFLAGLYLFTACKQDSGGGAPVRGPSNSPATINCNVPNPPASCGDANSSTTSTTTDTTGIPNTVVPNCFVATTSTACPAITGCMWTGVACVPTTLPTIPTTTGTTGTPAGTTTASQSGFCTPLETQAECASAPGCDWNGSSCTLTGMTAAPQPKSCTALSTAAKCAAGITCHWTGTVCNRPSVALNTTFAFGDGLSNVGTPGNPTINCNFSLIFQSDGNLVIFQGANPIWSKNPVNKNAATFKFTSDGRAGIYNSANALIWPVSDNSKTDGKGALYLLLSQAGNLAVLNSSNMILWDSKSTVAGCY